MSTNHRGIYITPEPVPRETKIVMVGPYTVMYVRKRDYNLYRCDVLGVTISRTISRPSFAQLSKSLSDAVAEGKLRRSEVEKLWGAAYMEDMLCASTS